MTYRKKLIEVALPLEAINAPSGRENSIRAPASPFRTPRSELRARASAPALDPGTTHSANPENPCGPIVSPRAPIESMALDHNGAVTCQGLTLCGCPSSGRQREYMPGSESASWRRNPTVRDDTGGLGSPHCYALPGGKRGYGRWATANVERCGDSSSSCLRCAPRFYPDPYRYV